MVPQPLAFNVACRPAGRYRAGRWRPTTAPRARGSAILAAALQTRSPGEVAAISPRKRQALGAVRRCSSAPRYTAATVVLSGERFGAGGAPALLDAVACGGQPDGELARARRGDRHGPGRTGARAPAAAQLWELDQASRCWPPPLGGSTATRGCADARWYRARRSGLLPFADGEFDALTITCTLRRRSRADDARAGARGAAGWSNLHDGVRCVPTTASTSLVKASTAPRRCRPARPWLSLAAVGRSGPLSGARHHRLPAPAARSGAVAFLARGRDARRARAARISLGAGVVISGTRDGVVD